MAIIWRDKFVKSKNTLMWCPNMNIPGNSHAKHLQVTLPKSFCQGSDSPEAPLSWYFTGFNYRDEIVLFRCELKCAEAIPNNPSHVLVTLVNMQPMSAQDGDEWNSIQAIIGENL